MDKMAKMELMVVPETEDKMDSQVNLVRMDYLVKMDNLVNLV